MVQVPCKEPWPGLPEGRRATLRGNRSWGKKGCCRNQLMIHHIFGPTSKFSAHCSVSLRLGCPNGSRVRAVASVVVGRMTCWTEHVWVEPFEGASEV